MTNSTEATRKALEPHGYHYTERNGQIRMPTDSMGDLMHGGWILDADWEVALFIFLEDKSLTGARIADLAMKNHHFNMHHSGRVWTASIPKEGTPHWHWEEVIDGTPDEAIAALWLKVMKLTDPRSKA